MQPTNTPCTILALRMQRTVYMQRKLRSTNLAMTNYAVMTRVAVSAPFQRDP